MPRGGEGEKPSFTLGQMASDRGREGNGGREGNLERGEEFPVLLLHYEYVHRLIAH